MLCISETIKNKTWLPIIMQRVVVAVQYDEEQTTKAIVGLN